MGVEAAREREQRGKRRFCQVEQEEYTLGRDS